jgi:LacI family transcriptional regulator
MRRRFFERKPVGRPRSTSVTLTDVARAAGVSLATASKALNARAEVAPETRRRVLQAAKEMSFRPNALARGLVSGRTHTVGLLIDELAERFAFPVLLGAENALGDEENSVLLCDARGDAIRRRHHIQTLLARRVDGLIVLGSDNDVRPSLTKDISVPVVYVYGESDNVDDVSVLADDHGGARLAAEHLVALGRRRVGTITGPLSYRAARERVAALHEVLREADLPLDCAEPMYGEWSQQWGRQATHALLARHPEIDAIFCGNDQIAAGAAETLRDLGRDVPGDVAVVGYDNWEEFAAECRVPLTTVDLNLAQLGATAVRLLLEAFEGRPTSGVVHQPGRLVIRQSTGVAHTRPS